MDLNRLRALSPTDGRYSAHVAPLRDLCSEFGLLRFRVLVEVRWLQALADLAEIPELSPLDSIQKSVLNSIVDEFSLEDAERIKQIEETTNHDVKAVEYFLRERLERGMEAKNLGDFLHFACTSEDINNLSYALMLRHARGDVLHPAMRDIDVKLQTFAKEYADLPMLSRTHGQAASPTSVGKEFANVAARLKRARQSFDDVDILGKCNGAVGNFNAHVVAYPNVDWVAFSQRFVESLGLSPNMHTTQIEPHDWTAAYCHALSRYNTVLLDFCRDIWSYISISYFRQRIAKNEVGSSTMPHKVNPIDFENAEGNLGLANAMLNHMAAKLPVSRWQRDLTDSTVQRNLGVALGYTAIALRSLLKGLEKLDADEERIRQDVDEAWEVVGEAVQTVMRRYGIPEPYEKLKALTRGTAVTRELLHDFIQTLEIPPTAKKRLLELTPSTYLGSAAELARKAP